MSGLADGVTRARRLLEEADRLVAVTGAGVSAESGVPTFRGEEGLWKSHRPEELATPGAFRRDPRLVWEWYGWRRERIGGCDPNPAHRTLARLARDRGLRVITQNVDGLHEAAAVELRASPEGGGPGDGPREVGSSGPADLPERERPLALHGSIFHVRCTACDYRAPRRDPIDASSRDSLPACPHCGALLRPDVVWFGESLDPNVLGRASSLAHGADLCLVVGTSAVVQPAASIPLATLRSGGRVVEVNPDATPLSSSAEVALRGRAGEILPKLIE